MIKCVQMKLSQKREFIMIIKRHLAVYFVLTKMATKKIEFSKKFITVNFLFINLYTNSQAPFKNFSYYVSIT